MCEFLHHDHLGESREGVLELAVVVAWYGFTLGWKSCGSKRIMTVMLTCLHEDFDKPLVHRQ